MNPDLIKQLELAIAKAICWLGFHKRKLVYEGEHTAHFGYAFLFKCQRCGKLQRTNGLGYDDEVPHE